MARTAQTPLGTSDRLDPTELSRGKTLHFLAALSQQYDLLDFMDPVTVLGVFCNVLDLVKTAIKLSKTVKELHDKGSSKDYEELGTWHQT